MKLSIIILSYNTKALLKQTLESIKPQPDWEIIVVDNASTDGSPDLIVQKFPEVKLVRNQHNLGFASGNNIGIKLSQGEYVMLLNSDTKIVGSAIQDLLDYLDGHPQVGMITPKVILEDGAIDLACHRGMPTPWNAFTYFTKLEQLFPNSRIFGGYHLTHKNFNSTHEIAATAATAVIVSAVAIRGIGLLDERFFLYAEDLDWCKRLTDAGWKIIYYPKATVLHFKSRSGKNKDQALDNANPQDKHASIHHFYDTMKQFYEKHYRGQYPWVIRQLVYLGINLKKWTHRR